MPFAGSKEALHVAYALDALVRLFAHEVLDEATGARTSRLVLRDVAACRAAADEAGINRAALTPLLLLSALAHVEPPLDGLAAYIDADRRGTLGPYIEWPDAQPLVEFLARARRTGAALVNRDDDDARPCDAITLALDAAAKDGYYFMERLTPDAWHCRVNLDGDVTSLGISALTHALVAHRPPAAANARVVIELWTLREANDGDAPHDLFRAARSMIASVFEHARIIEFHFGTRALNTRRLTCAALAELPFERITNLTLYCCEISRADMLSFLCSLRRDDLALRHLLLYLLCTDAGGPVCVDEHGVVCCELLQTTLLQRISIDYSASFSTHIMTSTLQAHLLEPGTDDDVFEFIRQ